VSETNATLGQKRKCKKSRQLDVRKKAHSTAATKKRKEKTKLLDKLEETNKRRNEQ